MASASPILVKLAAVLLGIVSLRAAGGGVLMVTRFGAVGDALFLLGVATCLLVVAIGVYRGRVDGLALGVAVLWTVAARLMLDAIPIIKYRLFGPIAWLPLTIATAVGLTALLLPLMPNARRWFAESSRLTER